MEKNKKLIGLAACSMIFTLSAAVLAGCGGTSHNIRAVTGVDPTCTEDGHKAYFECTDCDKIFSDIDGKTEIKLEDTVLPKTGHSIQHKNAKDAECTEEGNTEYWYCGNDCGTYWSDAQGTKVIEDHDSVIVEATNHEGTISKVDYVAPTPTTEGTLEHWHCSSCKKDYKDNLGRTELTDTSIPVVQEKTVDISVSLFHADGTKVTDTGAVKFVIDGGFDYNKYTDVAVENGKLKIAKLYEGEYTISADGFISQTFKVTNNLTEKFVFVAPFGENKNDIPESSVSYAATEKDGKLAKVVNLKNKELLDNIGDSLGAKRSEVALTLTQAEKDAIAFRVTTTVRLVDGDNGAADRCAIMLTDDFGGIMFWPSQNGGDNGYFNLSTLDSSEDYPSLNQCRTNLMHQQYNLSAMLSSAGMQVRLERLSNKITLSFLVDGEWTEVASVSCAADAKNDLRLLASHAEWEFSAIQTEIIQTESVDYKAPTEEAEGHRAHVKITDGDNVKYMLNGEFVTWSEIEIPVLEASQTTVKIGLIALDGTAAAIPDGFTLTLASDSITYENVTLGKDGTLNLGTGKKLYAETYKVTADGYFENEISISKAAVTKELKLVPEFYTETNPNGKVNVTYGDDMSIVIDCSEENRWDADQLNKDRGEVKLTLTDAQKNAKNVAVEFTVKILRNDQDDWAGNRFGIQMTDTFFGYVIWVEGSDRVDEIAHGNNNHWGSLDQWDYDTRSGVNHRDVATTEDGLRIRVERVGTAIGLSYFIDGNWKLIYSSRYACGADDNTDIRFLGACAKYKFSDIKVTTPTVENVAYKAPTETETGNKAYVKVTDGEKVSCVLNGKFVAWSEVELVLQVSAVTVKAELVTKEPVADDFTLTLVSDSITYENVTLGKDGVLNFGTGKKLYAGTYRVTAEGFGTVQFTVGESGEPVTLTLYQGFENSNPTNSSSVAIEYQKDGDNVTQKITLVSNGSGASSIYENRAEVQLLLTQDQKVADYVIVSGKLKFTGKNDNLSRGGMTMTTDWDGFMLWQSGSSLERHPGNGNLDQTESVGAISYEELTAGIEFRLVRVNTLILLYIKGETDWELRASVSCLENVENDVRFAGGLGTWEYSDLQIETPAYEAHAALAPTATQKGNAAYYTLTIGNAAAEYYLADGTPIASNGMEVSTIASADMVDLMVQDDVPLTVDLDAKTLKVGNVLRERNILAYQRYGKKDSVDDAELSFYEKDEKNMIGNAGLFDSATGTTINDFCGDTKNFKFTSNNITNSSTGITSTDGANKKNSVTLSLTKEVKQIALFTGSWVNEKQTFTLAEKSGATVSVWSGIRSGSRPKVLLFYIDSTLWGEETSHDLVLTIEGKNVEYAALVLLGDEAETNSAVKANMSWNAVSTDNTVIDLDGDTLDGRNILAYQRYGKTEATNEGTKAYYEKDDSNMIGNTGLFEMTKGDTVNDFGGNVDCIKFTSNSITNSSSGITSTDGQYKEFSVTLSLTKDVKQIVLYSGTWVDWTALNYTLKDSSDKTICGARLKGANPRPICIVIDLDTSTFADEGATEVTLTLGGHCCMYAALVLLGDTVTE